MDIEQIKIRLSESKNFIDELLVDDVISTTDYQTFYEIALRIERKIVKRELKSVMAQKLADKKTKTKG
jgi:hypothetical protein